MAPVGSRGPLNAEGPMYGFVVAQAQIFLFKMLLKPVRPLQLFTKVQSASPWKCYKKGYFKHTTRPTNICTLLSAFRNTKWLQKLEERENGFVCIVLMLMHNRLNKFLNIIFCAFSCFVGCILYSLLLTCL
jgi:hypothetical protein